MERNDRPTDEPVVSPVPTVIEEEIEADLEPRGPGDEGPFEAPLPAPPIAAADPPAAETADEDDGGDDGPGDGTDVAGGTRPLLYDVGAGVPDEVQLSRLESLIFVSPEPIGVRRLARLLGIEGRQVRDLIGRLAAQYRTRGIVLEEISGGFQFRSAPGNAAVVREAFKVRPIRLTRPALEALAIIAYRQPITRPEIEHIRGVDSGRVLKFLFEHDLVRVLGRKEEPGRPILYGTTATFLALFGLRSLADLPALHEFSDLWEEHQLLVDAETEAEALFDHRPLGAAPAAVAAADGPPPTSEDETP